jgi:hypothetical protein
MRWGSRIGLLTIHAWVASCGPKAPEAESCRVRLPPPSAPDLAPATFEAPPSTVRADVDIPLASIKRELEAKIGKRLAEERDHDLGIAGRLEYTVDRGPFAVSVNGDALVVETPLDAHARACAKGQCYAGCDPQLRATARVPMRLGADYKFRPSSVRVDVVRGCTIAALGGFVRIDLTPTIQSRLAQEQKRIEAQINQQLPDLRPEAERLWSELGKPRPLALGSCVVVAPEAITQGTPGAAGDAARIRLGLVARPELRMRCGDVAAPKPLPPLRDDPKLPDDGDVHLAVVLPPDAIAVAGESLEGAQARIARASGNAAALSLAISGEVCGDALARANGAAWDASGHAIRLTGAVSDASGVARAVEKTSVPVPFSADEAKTLLPELARSFTDDRVSLSLSIKDARAETAGLRGVEPIAVVLLRGVVTLRTK